MTGAGRWILLCPVFLEEAVLNEPRSCLRPHWTGPRVRRLRGRRRGRGPGYQQKATAAFALGHYAEAAESLEKAVAASPEPALLYNAAQAYRLAGNKARALTLCENYLRVYGGAGKRAELESRVEEFKKAIEPNKVVVTKLSNETVSMSPASAAPATLPNASPPADQGGTPILVNQPSSSSFRGSPLTSKVRFWTAIGTGVVAAVVVGVVLATGGSEERTPSLGKVNGI